MKIKVLVISMLMPVAMQAFSQEVLKSFQAFGQTTDGQRIYSLKDQKLTLSPAVALAVSHFTQTALEKIVDAYIPQKSVTVRGKTLSTNDGVKLLSAALVYAGVDCLNSSREHSLSDFRKNVASHALAHIVASGSKAVYNRLPEAVTSRAEGINASAQRQCEEAFGEDLGRTVSQAASFIVKTLGYYIVKNQITLVVNGLSIASGTAPRNN